MEKGEKEHEDRKKELIDVGGIMNPAAAFMVSAEGINLKVLFAYYITGLPMDLIHAFGTVIVQVFRVTR